jgi:curved DNA-binding protein CbpA
MNGVQRNDTKNYYEILEVPYNASQDDIRAGYMRSKNAYSGDGAALYSVLTNDECAEMLDLIETAYSVLSVPYKRREYDEIRGFKTTRTSFATLDNHEYGLPQARNGHSLAQISSPKSAAPQMQNFSSASIHSNGQESNHNHHHESLSYQTEDDDFRINRKEAEVSKTAAQKRFQLDYKKDHSLEQEIENALEFTGEFLKKIREYKNVTIERMSDLTRISKTYIRQIELDDYSKLPAFAYVRGFVYQYAKSLKLNPDLVAKSYLKNLQEKKKRET